MFDDFMYPRMPCKQIERWGIKSTSDNFRPYQIQTANIHFNNKIQIVVADVVVMKMMMIMMVMRMMVMVMRMMMIVEVVMIA